MKLAFPSREFDEAVAAVCHGSASDEQMRELNQLLRNDSAARDEYILRLELHSRLASDPDLFVSTEQEASEASLTGWPLSKTSKSSRFSWSNEAPVFLSCAITSINTKDDEEWNVGTS